MKKRKNISLVAAVLALIGLGYFFREHYLWSSTDDAYIQAHVLMLSARISGTVGTVLVNENDKVKAGQVLAQMEDQDYSSAYNQSAADVASLEADMQQAKLDYERAESLLKDKAISQQQYDQAAARYKGLVQRVKAANFKARQSQLNLSYTQISAPDDGSIAKRAVEPGMVVPAGQALFGFVSSRERWVTANFKETQLDGIKPGAEAQVSVDALDGRTLKGHVDSIGSSTGSTFTLLPPDNSTGNFTKVVQRVPVKIALDNLTPADIDMLQAGLSAVVSVKVH
jgi:membrane fusion protein (multidrug efflux system)